MNHRSLIFACGWLVAFGLTGCAELAGKPPLVQSGNLAQQGLYQMAAWKLEGRIGAKMGQEGWNANLFWEHEGGQDRLRISGPFSQGAVSIIVQSDLVYVNEGNGVVSSSRDPDEWLKKRLGFTVPLRSLRYWVLGLTAPDVPFQPASDGAGNLTGFTQQGWVLAFDSYDRIGDFVLPKKMSIRGSEVSLKLIADEWVLKK
jgi:outer membrane lipoprotein LolB